MLTPKGISYIKDVLSITILIGIGNISRFSFVTIFTIIVTTFVRILYRDIQRLLDFRYKIVMPWLLRGISE